MKLQLQSYAPLPSPIDVDEMMLSPSFLFPGGESFLPKLCANKEQKPDIFLVTAPNLPRARLATAAAKLDISPGNVPNKMVLRAAWYEALVLTAINVFCRSILVDCRWKDRTHCSQLSHEQ